MRLARITAGLVGVLIGMAGQSVCAIELEFAAVSDTHEQSIAQYRGIWQKHGARIIQALNRATGVELGDQRIQVFVRESVSRSGTSGQPMYLRASYPEPIKRATLVHELAHRYLLQLESDSEYRDIHFPLSLLLYEVWGELWGEDFAKVQAEVESGRSQRYEEAWDWVLSMSDLDRVRRWDDYISGRHAHTVSGNAPP